MGYGYAIAICVVLFVAFTGGFGILLWSFVNRNEIKRSLLTHPRDRKRADRDQDDDLQTDAQSDDSARQ